MRQRCLVSDNVIVFQKARNKKKKKNPNQSKTQSNSNLIGKMWNNVIFPLDHLIYEVKTKMCVNENQKATTKGS